MEEAKALSLAEANLKKQTNQVLYIIYIKESQEVFYITGKLSKSSNSVEAVGFFLNKEEDTLTKSKKTKETAVEKIKTVQEALECAKKLKLEIREIEIPWHRIALIENLTAKAKHNKA